jgi:hypothetical protein
MDGRRLRKACVRAEHQQYEDRSNRPAGTCLGLAVHGSLRPRDLKNRCKAGR